MRISPFCNLIFRPFIVISMFKWRMVSWSVRTSDDNSSIIFRRVSPNDNLVSSEPVAAAQHQSRLVNQKRQLARGLYGACPLEEEVAVDVALELVVSLDHCTRKWAIMTLLRVLAEGRFATKVRLRVVVALYH